MTYQDIYQQGLSQNPAQWMHSQNPTQWMQSPLGATGGFGQAAYGQAGQFGLGQFGGGGQRQLSPQDVGEVVRQIVPLLPQVLAQSQQPLAAFGYGGYGMGQQRQLTPGDVNEVVRQLLPMLPQIVGAIQHGQYGQMPMHIAAMYGGLGQFGQTPFGQSPYQQGPFGQGQIGQFGQSGQFGPQSQLGQTGWPMQAAYGTQGFGARQLSPQDVNEVVRQLTTIIPQVIGNLQASGQRPN
jgi:hypothetical protein